MVQTTPEKTGFLSRMLSRPVMAMTVIAVLTTVLYLPSINGEFIFDDNLNIVENPIVKDLSYYTNPSKALGLTRYDALRRRPVGFLTLTANYLVGEMDTTGYHVVNMLIHAANALLVYVLVLLLFQTPFLRASDISGRSRSVAFLAAIVFAVHPIQTQAVSYIVQRLASLATLFYLASVSCYLAFRLSEGNKRKILFYIMSIAAAVLGMYTKEITVTIPICVLMLELFFFTGPLKQRLAWWAPMGLTMFIIPLTVLSTRSLHIADVQGLKRSLREQTMPRDDFMMTECRVIITYLRLIIFPFNQNLYYDFPMYRSFFGTEVLTSLAFLCSLAGGGIYLFKKSRTGNPSLRIIAMGVAWFFLTISVESSVVLLFPIFEHRLYLPLAGVSIGASTGAVLFSDRLKHPRSRRAVLALAVAVPLALAGATFTRNFTWQTRISMWEDVVNKSPKKSGPHLNLGKAYKLAGMEEKSMEQFEASLQSHTFGDYLIRIKSFINMGNHYYEMGDTDRAIEYFKRSIELDPDYEMGYFNLATVYLNEGDVDKALDALETAIKKNPGFPPSHYLRGEALMKQRNPVTAVESYRKAVELDPESGIARLGLASALEALGRSGEALAAYRLAATKLPDRADVQYMLGNALKESGDVEAAKNAWTRAVELNPEHAGALSQLGGYYMLKGDYPRAIQYMEHSLQYNEQNAEAHYNLGMALENLGRTKEAASHFNRFVELAPPEYADVVNRVKEKLGGMQ